MSDFKELQQEFIDYIRAPEAGEPPEGTDERHMAVYRELFFNNVCSFVDNGFPVLKSLYDPDRWQARQRQFFANHDCTSPLFVDISRSFVDFLAESESPEFAWEAQLAEYEYLELWVDTQEEVTDQALLNIDQIEQQNPLALYKAAALGIYDYPVQQISQDNPAPEAAPTFLLVYRDREDEVAFSELNPLTAQLMITLSEKPGSTLNELQQLMVEAVPQLDKQTVELGVAEILVQMAQRGIVRGQ